MCMPKPLKGFKYLLSAGYTATNCYNCICVPSKGAKLAKFSKAYMEHFLRTEKGKFLPFFRIWASRVRNWAIQFKLGLFPSQNHIKAKH